MNTSRQPWQWALPILFLAQLLFGCSLFNEDSLPPKSGSQDAQLYSFKQVKCNYDKLPVQATCGYLAVPQDHNRPDGPLILLAVTILKARNPSSAPDAVVYLAGGPGSSATLDVEIWAKQPFLKRRDLVLVDQRGTGNSSPNLNCPELERIASRFEATKTLEAAQSCHERLVKEGIDLSLFNSTQSAADLEALRQTLGYKRWNLLGASYGSRLALIAMRDYPEGIRSAILDSANPPQVNAFEEEAINGALAFQALFQGCAANQFCNAAFPDLPEVFYELMQSLDNNPVQVNLPDPTTGEDVTVLLDGARLANQIFTALYSVSSIELVPYVIYALHDGNYQALAYLYNEKVKSQRLRQEEEDLANSEGLFYSVLCREETPHNDWQKAQQIAQTGPTTAVHLLKDIRSLFDVCAIWEVETDDAGGNLPIQSDINTLILAGEYDPVTPPAWGQAAAQYLPRSQFFLFPGLGHTVLFDHPCPQSIIADFLESPRQTLDPACLKEMRGTSFYTP